MIFKLNSHLYYSWFYKAPKKSLYLIVRIRERCLIKLGVINIWIKFKNDRVIQKIIFQKETFKIFIWLLRYLGILCRFPLPKNRKISFYSISKPINSVKINVRRKNYAIVMSLSHRFEWYIDFKCIKNFVPQDKKTCLRAILQM